MFLAMLLCAAVVAADGFNWKPWNDGSGDYSLMRGDAQHGFYRGRDGRFFPLDRTTRVFGPACEPPIEPPVRHFGVIPTDRPSHQFLARGEVVSEQEAFAYIRDDPRRISVPEDAGKLRVAVIGQEQETARVVGAWEGDAALSPFRDAMLFSAWHPDDWQIADYGFHTAGKPTIYCLAPNGEVLHRQDDFDGGAAALAEALREADAAYQAKRDRDRRKVLNGVAGIVERVPLPAWALGAFMVGAAGVIALRRKG